MLWDWQTKQIFNFHQEKDDQNTMTSVQIKTFQDSGQGWCQPDIQDLMKVFTQNIIIFLL